MIIHRIQAENFLKYADLDIDNLPAKGLIAVSGQNESGKTSIGETLCFALFGRTFTLQLDDPHKLIRWGESQCSVTVNFSGKDDSAYQIKRYLDDEGAYGARLVRDTDGAIITKGVDQVDAELQRLIGFGYDEFIESFYLAQRELSTPHPHSHTIKVMAGVAPLTDVASGLVGSIDDEKVLQSQTSNDYQDAQNSLDELGINEQWHPQLNSARDNFQAQLDQKLGLTDRLTTVAEGYRDGLPKLKSARWARNIAQFLGVVFLLVAAALWVIWGLYQWFPDYVEVDKSTQLVTTYIPDWEQRYKAWLLPLAILFSALFLLELVLLFKMRGKVKRLQEQVAELPEHLDVIRLDNQRSSDPLPDAIESLVEAPSEALKEDDEAALSINFLPRIKQLETRTSTLSANFDEVTEGEAFITARLEQDASQIQHQLDSLDVALTQEQGRLDYAAQLFSVRDSLNIKLADQMHRIKVHEMSSSLLDSASHHLSHRFNQSILKLAGEALPKFTQGRYQHLKIDENLDVRVFSNEKHDFMGFEEISSGTQRQIMLALRLAMSQELISAIETGRQFIFFDEPFAFFDQQRIRETLNALPDFSEEISQIWLVAQEFPDQVDVDLHIACSRDERSFLSR
ncbi:MAG TPA: ATPase [Gammaproteobacteria bacterium]|nr:ATPase [Gammaproteobacteria bacterium]